MVWYVLLTRIMNLMYTVTEILHLQYFSKKVTLKLLNQYDFLLVSFQINLAKNQAYVAAADPGGS